MTRGGYIKDKLCLSIKTTNLINNKIYIGKDSNDNPNYGKRYKHTKETKLKISNSLKGRSKCLV